MQKNSFTISLVFLLTGFITAYFIFGYPAENTTEKNGNNSTIASDEKTLPANPFSTKNENALDRERLNNLENEVSRINQQLQAFGSLMEKR